MLEVLVSFVILTAAGTLILQHTQALHDYAWRQQAQQRQVSHVINTSLSSYFDTERDWLGEESVAGDTATEPLASFSGTPTAESSEDVSRALKPVTVIVENMRGAIDDDLAVRDGFTPYQFFTFSAAPQNLSLILYSLNPS